MVPPNNPELLRRGYTSNSGASRSSRFGGDRAACPFEITPDLGGGENNKKSKDKSERDSIPGSTASFVVPHETTAAMKYTCPRR